MKLQINLMDDYCANGREPNVHSMTLTEFHNPRTDDFETEGVTWVAIMNEIGNFLKNCGYSLTETKKKEWHKFIYDKSEMDEDDE